MPDQPTIRQMWPVFSLQNAVHGRSQHGNGLGVSCLPYKRAQHAVIGQGMRF